MIALQLILRGLFPFSDYSHSFHSESEIISSIFDITLPFLSTSNLVPFFAQYSIAVRNFHYDPP